MGTPDEIRNAAGFGSGEQLQLAATSLAFAGATSLLGIGVQQMKQAAHGRACGRRRKKCSASSRRSTPCTPSPAP